MDHDERHWLCPREQALQSVCDPQECFVDALPLRQALRWWVLLLPGPVGIDGRPVVDASADLGEVRFDHQRHVTAVQC